MSEYKLETKEAIALMVNLLCNKLFVLAPFYLKQIAGNTALIVTATFYLVAFTLWSICSKMNDIDKDLLDITTNHILRKFLGSIIALSITVVTILTPRQYAEGIKVMALQNTPINLIIVVFGVAMLSGAFLGLKSIGKTNGFFVPLIFIVTLILVFATFKRKDLVNLFPVFGNGFGNIATSSIIMLSMLFEVTILFMLPSVLKAPGDFQKIGRYTFLWSGICFISVGGIYSISSPGHQSVQSYEPFFRLIKQIEFGNFLQRFDSFFLILYCISAFLYLSAMLYFGANIFAKTFDIKKSKRLILPIGLIISFTSAVNFLEEYMFYIVGKSNYILWIIAFAIPLTILLISKLRSTE